MESPRERDRARRDDVEALVVDRFAETLGLPAGPALAADLRDELGLDSVGLVTVLLDLSDELGVDLASSRVSLAGIETVGDVVELFAVLSGERDGTSVAAGADEVP